MAWFSGWAMAPTSRWAVPRGSSVSASRVSTKRTWRSKLEVANLDRKAIEVASDQPVEIEQLAALALPSHPDALARVEDAVPMEEREAAKCHCRHTFH